MTDVLTCCHCWKPAPGTWTCSECKDQPLCSQCAIDVGLFGLGPIIRQQQQREKAKRIKAAEKRAEEREQARR